MADATNEKPANRPPVPPFFRTPDGVIHMLTEDGEKTSDSVEANLLFRIWSET